MDLPADRHRVVILGAGFSGLAAAIRLSRAGIRDFVVLERAKEVGGTWRDNTYPGCACDVPAHLYSLSVAPKSDWRHHYAPQAEIFAYLKETARREGLYRHLRFEQPLEQARWEEDGRRWLIEAGSNRYSADLFIVAPGPLSEPKLPEIEGLDLYEGELFHSARWNHNYPLCGKRVAVIGTGASAIQLVPQIQPLVDRLYVFQRTPPWVLPIHNRPLPTSLAALFTLAPPVRQLFRGWIYASRELLVPFLLQNHANWVIRAVARHHLRRQVKDPKLRKALTPDYPLGCKRVLLSDDYYPALQQPNVTLVTDPIHSFTRDGVRTKRANGSLDHHRCEAVILATGFQTSEIPVAARIYGRNGRSLAQFWDGSPRAYLGATVPGFPSLFFLYGPNTNLGHNSVLFMVECQLNHLLAGVAAISRAGATGFEVRAEAYHRYNKELEAAFGSTVWEDGNCRSWYLDANGRNGSIWPRSTIAYYLRTRRFDCRDYLLLYPGHRQLPSSQAASSTIRAVRA